MYDQRLTDLFVKKAIVNLDDQGKITGVEMYGVSGDGKKTWQWVHTPETTFEFRVATS